MNYKSPLCSCIVCHETKSVKGIFSHYLRVHGTSDEQEKMNRCNQNHTDDRHRTNKNKLTKRKIAYARNANKCAHCNVDLSYSRRRNKFCSRSCATSYNNKNHSPGRKFGPKKTKLIVQQIPKIKKQKVIKSKRVKVKKFVWKKHISGPFSKLFVCTCSHCNVRFVSRKVFKYCSIHRDRYARARNQYEFTFNVFNFPDLFDLSLILRHEWYSPGNRHTEKNNNGVSRDHRVSVNESIKNEYDPFYITHPLNCEIMPHNSNKQKYTKSSLKYEELVKLVDAYEMARDSGIAPHPLHQQTDSLAGCA